MKFHHQPVFAILTVIIIFCTGCQPNTQVVSESPIASETQALSTTEVRQTEITAIPSVEPTSKFNVPEEDLKGVKIVLLHAMGDAAEKQMQQLSRDFNAQNPWGIVLEVKGIATYADLSAEITAGLESGKNPNLVVATPEQLDSWQSDYNVVIDLKAYIADPVWGLEVDSVADYFPHIWNLDGMESDLIGLPAMRSAEVIVYNRTWAHELGYKDPPLTPLTFTEQACAAAKASTAEGYTGMGGWFMDTNPYVGLSWLSAFNAESPFSSTENKYTFNINGSQRAFMFLRDLAEQNCAWNNEIPTPEESTEPFIYFANRETLLASLAVDELPILEAAMNNARNSDDWVALPYPTEDGEGRIVVYGYNYGMLLGSPTEELASWLVLRWLVDPEQAVLLSEVTATLPLTNSAAKIQSGTVQFDQAVALIGLSLNPPIDGSWVKVQPILRDAMWENMVQYQRIHAIENSPVRSIEDILDELDSMAAAILK